MIGRMVDLVREIDPLFFEKVGSEESSPSDLPEAEFPRARGDGDAFAREFDARLEGRVSKLVDSSPQAPRDRSPRPCALPSA